MQLFLRFLALCAAFALLAPLAIAQQDASPDNGERRLVWDNIDVTPRVAGQSEKQEKVAQPESAPVSRGPKVSRKKAVLKNATAPPKGAAKSELTETKSEASDTAAEPVAPPAPRIYSELHTSIDDSGQLVLTSDTIVVKPEISSTAASLKLSESTGNRQLDEIIQKAANKHQVDPRLILEVMRQESGFHAYAVSNKGARGLMQLIPSTAARFGIYRLHDPVENVEGGTRYLRFLLDTFKGNIELVLAGYNAGENAVIRNNFHIPPYRETRDYVRSITARYRSKYHQIGTAKTEALVVHQAPLITFAAEDGRVILSNNY